MIPSKVTDHCLICVLAAEQKLEEQFLGLWTSEKRQKRFRGVPELCQSPNSDPQHPILDSESLRDILPSFANYSVSISSLAGFPCLRNLILQCVAWGLTRDVDRPTVPSIQLDSLDIHAFEIDRIDDTAELYPLWPRALDLPLLTYGYCPLPERISQYLQHVGDHLTSLRLRHPNPHPEVTFSQNTALQHLRIDNMFRIRHEGIQVFPEIQVLLCRVAAFCRLQTLTLTQPSGFSRFAAGPAWTADFVEELLGGPGLENLLELVSSCCIRVVAGARVLYRWKANVLTVNNVALSWRTPLSSMMAWNRGGTADFPDARDLLADELFPWRECTPDCWKGIGPNSEPFELGADLVLVSVLLAQILNIGESMLGDSGWLWFG
ncbi:hypothetical protein FB45DRAFT_869004 [Roridomyces roridus]|uniref:Uncharacterized protein n=1 Tax=Roridomyces roridus TaxID=1738132 RepID=A0AAD7BN11_9AGAR|nr:hypothetical protein FB45DRAFT_869004 [Roridomyces roridus]